MRAATPSPSRSFRKMREIDGSHAYAATNLDASGGLCLEATRAHQHHDASRMPGKDVIHSLAFYNICFINIIKVLVVAERGQARPKFEHGHGLLPHTTTSFQLMCSCCCKAPTVRWLQIRCSIGMRPLKISHFWRAARW